MRVTTTSVSVPNDKVAVKITVASPPSVGCTTTPASEITAGVSDDQTIERPA